MYNIQIVLKKNINMHFNEMQHNICKNTYKLCIIVHCDFARKTYFYFMYKSVFS